MLNSFKCKFYRETFLYNWCKNPSMFKVKDLISNPKSIRLFYLIYPMYLKPYLRNQNTLYGLPQ